MSLFLTAALAFVADVPSSTSGALSKPWDPWNYGAASQCVLKELGETANAKVTAAVVGKTTTDLTPVFDLCAKRTGLDDRPYEAQQYLNAVAATSYVKAAECASDELASLKVNDFDRERKKLEANPEGYWLPADIQASVATCNPDIFGWYATRYQVNDQILKTLRYARKWRDQLADWKRDKKLHTPEGRLALCIVEKNSDGAVALISRVQGVRDLSEGRVMASKLLPDVASSCVSPYPTGLSTDKLMTHIVNFFLVSLDKQKVRG